MGTCGDADTRDTWALLISLAPGPAAHVKMPMKAAQLFSVSLSTLKR